MALISRIFQDEGARTENDFEIPSSKLHRFRVGFPLLFVRLLHLSPIWSETTTRDGPRSTGIDRTQVTLTQAQAWHSQIQTSVASWRAVLYRSLTGYICFAYGASALSIYKYYNYRASNHLGQILCQHQIMVAARQLTTNSTSPQSQSSHLSACWVRKTLREPRVDPRPKGSHFRRCLAPLLVGGNTRIKKERDIYKIDDV